MIKFPSAEYARSQKINYRDSIESEAMRIKKIMRDAWNDNKSFCMHTIWKNELTAEDFRLKIHTLNRALILEGYGLTWEKVVVSGTSEQTGARVKISWEMN